MNRTALEYAKLHDISVVMYYEAPPDTSGDGFLAILYAHPQAMMAYCEHLEGVVFGPKVDFPEPEKPKSKFKLSLFWGLLKIN